MPDPFGDHPVVLSDDDRDRVQAWVQAVKPQLGLSGWDVAVSRHQCDPGAKASSYVLDKADESVIALAGPLADAEASDLRATLTHELLHCHLQPLIVLVQVMVAGELGKRTEAIMLAAVEQVEERTIERMARAIAELLPFV